MMDTPRHVAVAVIGGGPAGAATALGLARAGVSVLVVERVSGRADPIGESLPPSVRPLLERLGVYRAFLATEPLPYHANRSAWGSDGVPAERSFFSDPRGHGWRVDRHRFDAMLLNEAVSCGALLRQPASVVRVTHGERGDWLVHVRDAEGCQPVSAGFVVDASGRARSFARRQGARWRRVDRLAGAVAFLRPGAAPLADSATLVEAVADGWWYSGVLPDGRLAVAFMTDPDLLRARRAGSASGWWSLLAGAGRTRERAESGGYEMAGVPRVVAADSGRLDRAAGDGWLAVGDAAAAHDPLSSHGIGAALDGGIRAAAAVRGLLEGDARALDAYADYVLRAYARYLWLWQSYYALERRWPDAPFWRRRHAAARPP